MVLDEIVNDPTNVEALRQAMVNAFIEDPMKIFRQIIMPLLPSEAIHKIQQEPSTIRWVSIMESVRMREAEAKAADEAPAALADLPIGESVDRFPRQHSPD